MSIENLFAAVDRLKAQRAAEQQQMQDFAQSLTGAGQVGYGIGRGLKGLFNMATGDGTDPEMLQAQREDAYAAQFAQADPARRAELLPGGYALSGAFGRDLEAMNASEAAALLEGQYKRAQIAKMLAEANKAKTEAADKKETTWSFPTKDQLGMVDRFVADTNLEEQYGMKLNQLDKFRIAGMLAGVKDYNQARDVITSVLGISPTSMPTQDKMADVKATADRGYKSIQQTDVTNPKSLSDPTEY